VGILAYSIKRVAATIPVVIGITFLVFVISHLVVSNPAHVWAGVKADPSTVAAITARYHLNDPILIQYFYYMRDLLKGDWGVSPVSGEPVLVGLLTHFPATLELGLAAIMVTVLIGIPLGVAAAVHQDQPADHGIRLLYLSGVSSPPFLVALGLLLVFFYYLRIFPSAGQLSPFVNPPPTITGMILIDALLAGEFNVFVDGLRHIVLPAMALALTTFGYVTRLTRSSMIEALGRDYVRTAYAKGLSESSVIYSHALRNAMITTTTVIGLFFGGLLSGAIVVETIFDWAGIGWYSTRAILALDFPSVMGVTIIFTLVVVTTNLIVDVIYAFLDPRIRLG
jgi:peptide/nickel transport system permease protein